MKIKRRILMLVLSATMLFSMVTVAYAYSTNHGKKTIKSEDYSLSLYGYIDLLSGGWFLEDEYYYRGVLSGDDIKFFPTKTSDIRIRILDDEGDVGKTIYLYYGASSVSGSFYYGRWSEYGKLIMNCCDAYGTVIGY